MAAPADKNARPLGLAGSTAEVTRVEFNTLVTQFRALCAKLDADAGVTDTNYVATISDAGPSKINVPGF